MAKRVSKDKAMKDLIWSEVVKDRDKYCQVCKRLSVKVNPKGVRLNAHHLIPREFIQWRWSIDNGITLCVNCHTFGKYSAHKNPIWFTIWLKENRPSTLILLMDRLDKKWRDY